MGILCANEELAKHYLKLGAQFVAVGVDTSLLNAAAKSLLAKFKDAAPITPVSSSGY
ncbi:4-hydroxy-2-oxo-heptane-1,7-dioate aldolase [compost metagenome]